ncbi:PAS domain S-box protein [Paludibaculum fermentans]|uniref:PAS domain-containing sensor histidine kinase n=1 Tax=Paludibaculum fermentans TaxID=1473598 RepID=UPI003EB86CB5
MKDRVIHVLLIEDNAIDALFVRGSLVGTSNPTFELRRADRLSTGLSQLAEGGVDALLLDLYLPDSEGLESFRRVQAAAPEIPVVVLSSEDNDEMAIAAVADGAQDYLVKGHYSTDLLTRSLRYAIERKRSQRVLNELAARLTHHVENSPMAVIEWGANLDVIRWAGEAERMFGWTPEEVLGKQWGAFPLVYAGDEAPVAEIFARLYSGGNQKCFSANRNCRKDGSVIHCEWYNSSLMDAQGNLRSILSLALDVTERKHAEKGLSLANQQLQRLSTDLLRSQDHERRRIARELHDSTAQILAALSMNLIRLQKPGGEPLKKQALLAESIELAASSSREIRTVTYLLHPPLLDEIGLVSALQAYAEGFNQRTGIEIQLILPPDFGRLESELESALFRIVQEGLANVHRHSGSPLAIIQLERNLKEVCLVLQDRGCGLPSNLTAPDSGYVGLGVGILGMRERADQLGGRLEITSAGNGTRVTVKFPLAVQNEQLAHISG